MSGTLAGGKATALKNLAKDPDYYKKMGQRGGSAAHSMPRGFATNKKLARIAGARGGRISRRTKKLD